MLNIAFRNNHVRNPNFCFRISIRWAFSLWQSSQEYKFLKNREILRNFDKVYLIYFYILFIQFIMSIQYQNFFIILKLLIKKKGSTKYCKLIAHSSQNLAGVGGGFPPPDRNSQLAHPKTVFHGYKILRIRWFENFCGY